MTVHVYMAPPAGETRFPFSSAQGYSREIKRCGLCGHFVSVHEMDTRGLYERDYVSATYGEDGMRESFQRIITLDPTKSDNFGRVQRILNFASTHFAKAERPLSVLDVGSGLCVFLHAMKAVGWDCTALDPDHRAIAHARDIVGVKAICADFTTAHDLGRFDVVTFNKVLEHVEDPVAMLARSTEHLRAGGFVYVEVPDGELAAVEGYGREEFFIEHHHVFSLASLALMAVRSGFRVHSMERLREPSTKYTLRAFFTGG